MRVWLIIVALGLAGTAFPVRAQTDDERARTHFQAGSSYYDQARYEDAAHEFQQAFDLSGRPEMLLNLSLTYERSLRYDQAIEAAERYLELAPAAENRKTVEDRIRNLQQLKLRFEQGGPAPLPPPGTPGAPEDPTAPSAVQPGAETERPTAAPAPTSPETQPGPNAATASSGAGASNRFTIPAIVLMGTGGAALVASLVTGLVAHADYKSLGRQCTPAGDCPPSAEDELDEGKTLSVLSTVLTIVGIAAAGTGGALLIIGANEAGEAGAPRGPTPGQVSFAPGPTPISASASWTF